MGKYQELTKDIPWGSFGRETVTSRVGRSLVPVGPFPFAPSPDEREQFLMSIVGTAIQCDGGKLVTTAHVFKSLDIENGKAFILAQQIRGNTTMYVPYPIQAALTYIDPRIDDRNPEVDLAILAVSPVSNEELSYDVPGIVWGDSTQLGLGDPVIVAGYPYGTHMFLLTEANRGIIQPAFCSGIVSAILPATDTGETRIIQISAPVIGRMSGGVVFNPQTGEALGMVTGGLDIDGIPQPLVYALPSEIISPFLEVLTFKAPD